MAARAFFIRITGVKDDDIVSRLRIRWDSMTDMGNYERAAAADEIERLRQEVADAYSKSADVLAKLSANLCTASALEREKIIAERDEARRWVCELTAPSIKLTPREFQNMRGWDCFNTPEAKVDKTLNGVIVDGGKAVPPKYEDLGDE